MKITKKLMKTIALMIIVIAGLPYGRISSHVVVVLLWVHMRTQPTGRAVELRRIMDRHINVVNREGRS
jgi:hypothetical protein